MGQIYHVFRTRQTDSPRDHFGGLKYSVLPSSSSADRKVTPNDISVIDQKQYYDTDFFFRLEQLTSGFKDFDFVEDGRLKPIRFDVHPNLPHCETYSLESKTIMYVLRENLSPQEITRFFEAFNRRI